jgi:hypothetical protein
LKELYTLYYPSVVNYCRLITKLLDNSDIDINSNTINKIYNELADGLNCINANYYIYYYLFSPGKIIKLSRFNFYQIDSNIPKFLYLLF